MKIEKIQSFLGLLHPILGSVESIATFSDFTINLIEKLRKFQILTLRNILFVFSWSLTELNFRIPDFLKAHSRANFSEGKGVRKIFM